uniref:glycosyltransferase n=1 Tax=Nonomuraea lactucae TaxID=2249762 RepID=UPI0013B43031
MTIVFACLEADALGGVQQVTHTLAQGLARRGHDVHVVGLHQAASPFSYVGERLYEQHLISRAPVGREGRLARGRADRRLAGLL